MSEINTAAAELQTLRGELSETDAAAAGLSASFSKYFKEMTAAVAGFARNAAVSLSGVTGRLKELNSEMSALGSQGGSAGADFSKQLGSGIDQGLAGVGGGLENVGAGFGNFGAGVASAGEGLSSFGAGLSGAGAGLSSAGEGLAALASALPLTAAGFSALLAVLPDLLANLPQILVFVGIMGAFSLLGPGLAAAGAGILGIGQGLLAMAQSLVTATSGLVSLGGALPLVNAGMLELINGLMNTEINIGGILTFVLLAASMFVMAEAIKSMNEHLGPMVANLGTLGNIFTTGLMVGITVFAVMMLLLSLAMGKVASGVDKVTKSFAAQYSQLQKNIPLLATAAILSNPIVGAITVAAATAAGFAIGAIIPQMAKGGVVASPTVAMVGEGRYPEAVVPLGSSPQFAEMNDDIANAVLQGIFAANRAGGSEKTELVLNLDGEKLARVIIPRINKENNRRGYALQLKEV